MQPYVATSKSFNSSDNQEITVGCVLRGKEFIPGLKDVIS